MDDKRRRRRRAEHHIHPVVGRVPCLVREAAGGAVGIHAVPAGDAVGKGVQRRAVHARRRKVVHIGAVVAGAGVVGGNIDRVGGHGHRAREEHLLPA